MHSRYLTMSLVAALACCAVYAQDEYSLQAFRITANAPVTVTLSHADPIQKPMYRPQAGEWSPLDARQQDGEVSFGLPVDAVGETIVLLTQPDWLTLPDGDAPQLAQASVDGVAVTPDGSSIACGAVAAPPTIELKVTDALNPILHSRVAAHLNGVPLGEFGGKSELATSNAGKSLSIRVLPGELPEDRYTLTVAVPDASPARNTLVATVSFSTAPLLRNGGFEAVSADGKPENWSFGSWGGSDPGEYKISVAEGQGRTGNALENLRLAARNGLDNGAIGFLVTDWGDSGHWQCAPVSFVPFAWGAAVSWAYDANIGLDLARAADVHVFEDRAGVMAQAALDLGNAHAMTGCLRDNSTVYYGLLLRALQGSPSKGFLSGMSAAGIQNARNAIENALSRMEAAKMSRPDAGLIRDEFALNARMALFALRLGEERLKADCGTEQLPESVCKPLRDELSQITDEFKTVWLARNRPGGLADSLGRLEALAGMLSK